MTQPRSQLPSFIKHCHNEHRVWPFRPQVFFCKYNDPIYVKLEKLEIMIKLASEKNIDQVRLRHVIANLGNA